MDISITASKGYCYAWCNAYTLETEFTTAIDNNMTCNGTAFGDITFSLDCNMTMPKAVCNCVANDANVSTDTNITADKTYAYVYAWCNAYELETEFTTEIDNDMICNGSAFNGIDFSLDCNMTMPKVICNCSANIATVDFDNLKFPKYTFTTAVRNLIFEG